MRRAASGSSMIALSVISRHSADGRQRRCSRSAAATTLGEVAARQLARREVDGHHEVLAAVRRATRRPGGRPRSSTHSPIGDDQAALLGDRRRSVGGETAPRVGCCQRSSASTPNIAAVGSGTSGW